MKRIVFAQLGWMYDKSVYYPLSSAMLAAAVKADPVLQGVYEVDPWLRYEREDPEKIVAGMAAPDVLALSMYVWCEQITLEVARRAKERWPNCLTVLGGPSVSGWEWRTPEALLRRAPWVDYVIDGEGEHAFRELLLAVLVEPKSAEARVANVAFIDGDGDFALENKPRPRERDLSVFPSPFLDGTLDAVLEHGRKKGVRFEGVWECSRGCPFRCTFCTWGSNTGAKMYTFPLERLRAEVEWIARNQIEFVYMGDSNFGMLPHDREIADMLVEAKSRWGYPKRVLANAPKNSSAKVFDLFERLKRGDMQKAITLSMQSWNPETLVAIKRLNIKAKAYEELQTLSKQRDIATYSEIILGLPGETLQSFCDGLDKSIDGGAHDGLLVYLCRVLPGSEMDSDAYREAHGIETVRLPIQANHGSLDAATVGPTEYEETVVATKTMPHEDWLEAQRIAWFVEVFFVLGIARLPLLWLREQGVKVTEFARWALRCHVLDRERIESYLISQDAGKPEVPRDGLDAFSAIRWPIEEASWLALMRRKDEVLRELIALLDAYVEQKFLPDEQDLAAVCLQSEVRKGFDRLKHWTDGRSPASPEVFAREVLWHGRRGGSMLWPPEAK